MHEIFRPMTREGFSGRVSDVPGAKGIGVVYLRVEIRVERVLDIEQTWTQGSKVVEVKVQVQCKWESAPCLLKNFGPLRVGAFRANHTRPIYNFTCLWLFTRAGRRGRRGSMESVCLSAREIVSAFWEHLHIALANSGASLSACPRPTLPPS